MTRVEALPRVVYYDHAAADRAQAGFRAGEATRIAFGRYGETWRL